MFCLTFFACDRILHLFGDGFRDFFFFINQMKKSPSGGGGRSRSSLPRDWEADTGTYRLARTSVCNRQTSHT